MLIADQGLIRQRFANSREQLQQRLDCFKNRQVVAISDSGHNIQHDQPEQVAAALDQFLFV